MGLKATGTAADVGYVIAGNRLDTEGYREHSAATRGVVNAKLTFAPADATRITVIGNTQNQPDSQDPLGLTQAQWESDPRQADPLAVLFDTRKTVNQAQGGVAVDHTFSPALSARVTTYGGRREVEQFLAFTGVGATSSGGVVNLDRDYGGVGVRFIFSSTLADKPLVITTGVDVDAMRETRRGYVNEFGTQGALRRDEDDTVRGGNSMSRPSGGHWRHFR